MTALASIEGWASEYGIANTAALVRSADRVLETFGDPDRVYQLASVTKLLTCYAVMVAVQEEALGLDNPAGPPGATVRHLLAHTAGYGFESGAGALSPPGTRRTYSNQGFEVLTAHLESVTGIEFGDYLSEAVLDPLGMTKTRLMGSSAAGISGTAADLSSFAAELLRPALLEPDIFSETVKVQFPGLAGVLPGVGRFDPLDWGLGFERNFGRTGHWAGLSPSRDSVGHFGAAGTFLWADPVRGISCISLSDRDFGAWALEAWPRLSTAVVQAYG
jgi:CubicO group peptidase (beta-lactamase class C family)